MYIGPVLVMTRGGGQVCRFLGLMRVGGGWWWNPGTECGVCEWKGLSFSSNYTAFALTSQKQYKGVLRGRRLGPSINRRPPFGISVERVHTPTRERKEGEAGPGLFFFTKHPPSRLSLPHTRSRYSLLYWHNAGNIFLASKEKGKNVWALTLSTYTVTHDTFVK